MGSLKEFVMAAIAYAERKVAWPDLGSQYPPTREQYIEWKLDDYVREFEEHMKDENMPFLEGIGTGWREARKEMLKFLKGESAK